MQNNGEEQDEFEELTPDLLERIVQFQEVTGVESMDESRRLLPIHGWDVESAVQHYLASVEASRDGIQLQSSDGLRQRLRSSLDEDLPASSPPRPVVTTSPPTTPGSTWGGRLSLLGYGLRLCVRPLWATFASFSALFAFVFRLVWPQQPRSVWDPQSDILGFISEFDSSYGTGHPQFFHGSYSQALGHAKSQLKFLLVYLHSTQHQDTALFCRDTLQHPELVSYLDSTMVVWGCSVTSPEGYRVSQALRENCYPFLAVIVVRSGRMTVVARLEGPSGGPLVLLQKLKDVVRDNEAHLVLARADRQEREQTAALREEQDQAYLASLLADKEKARQKQAEQDLRDNQEKEERLREGEEQRERECIAQRKKDYALLIPQEPPSSNAPSDDVIHILVKLPSGQRLERRFLARESMKVLYYYIFSHPEAPPRFEVLTNYPRKTVPCEPRTDEEEPLTFQEFRLPPRTMLLVTDLDA